jgi:hypothetical protein
MNNITPVGINYRPETYDVEASTVLMLLRDMLVSGAPNIKRQSTNALRNSISVISDTVVIGGGIVDYAPYTTYAWTHPRWNGAKNPNEGWVERLTIQAMTIAAMRLGYRVVVE